METTHKDLDAIVVGSGPGGATVAKELSQKNKKVLILERGGNGRIRGSKFQAANMMAFPGKGLLFTNMKMLALARGICTGGSSVFYCATAFDPPLELLKSYGIDIADEVDELKKELPIGPLSDDLMGPMAKRIMQSAQELGYDWKKLNKFIFQDKCRAGCWKCSYGCPYGAKWTARNFVEEATRNGTSLINGAKVKRVIFDGNAAVGVEYTKRGKTCQAFAPKVIISAGGIGSPVILRRSGLFGAGYDFFFDPLIMVMGAVKDIKGGKEPQMTAGIHLEDEGYMMVDLNFPTAVYLSMTAPKLRVHKLFSQSRTLMIMIKIRDNLGGRVTYRGGVRKSLSKDDKLKLKSGYERAKKILKNAGAKGIFKGWDVAAHPGGTVKVNDLLDSNLKTEKDNLYVCDCSVIPEAWGLPPTLTLLSLGKRLAKHLTA
jgi:choline dehydrogenase-like flavoprotein